MIGLVNTISVAMTAARLANLMEKAPEVKKDYDPTVVPPGLAPENILNKVYEIKHPTPKPW
jgi:hypothetical protein